MKKLRKIAHNVEEAFDHTTIKIKQALQLFDPVIIYPYRGYGNGKIARLHGRMLEKERMIHDDEIHEDTFWNNLRKVWKRYESDEIPGVGIEAEFAGITAKTVSDEEGYFDLVFEGLEDKSIEDGWYDIELRINKMPFDVDYEETTTGSIHFCNQRNEIGIISDVDDTIIKSEAMSLVKKLRIMLTENAKTRVAFDGAEKLYQKLTAAGKNPLFFVSGSSYNLYDMLVHFCDHQNIPKAPFFLRDLGLNAKQWLKQDTSEYKKFHINRLMQDFQNLSFILIGDSGQQDPEIYTEVYKKYPRQVKAIYIRHVYTDKRKKEVEEMAGKVDVPIVITDNSKVALQHALENGWAAE